MDGEDLLGGSVDVIFNGGLLVCDLYGEGAARDTARIRSR